MSPIVLSGGLVLEDWLFATGGAPRGEAYFPADVGGGLRRVRGLGSGPDHDLYRSTRCSSPIASARARVWLTTYFVPDEPALAALTTAALRGVDVRALVPREGDAALATRCGFSIASVLVNRPRVE